MSEDKPKNTAKRYATAAIIIGGGAVLGASALASHHSAKNYGIPITHNSQQYYIPGDSKRVVYPSREACMKDVPVHLQHECEPVANYRSGGGWYGPVYSSRSGSGYNPSGQYPTETADSSNVGKKFPGSANTHGFGANGKALTGSAGG